MTLIDNVKFGQLTFDKNMMKKTLPTPTYLKWKDATRNTEPLDKETADIIAASMKKWAIDNGATHYCHWFQPLNGRTAKKMESFIERSKDNEPIENFSGEELIKSESDASSFPSGGIRSTFEARGYNYWDLTSNSFILDKVMYIPSVFVSYTGKTLDKKLPLSKSLDYLSRSATNLVNKISDHKAYRTRVKLGLEQEFFLITQEMYERRMDLRSSGRTLFGYPRIKTQEQDHHYLGAIPARVLDFYEELNRELWKLGIYAKTEHNEVAPTQFEVASLYGDANISIDQNHMVMEMLRKTALKHGMVCLLHEKPYKKLNGSGKHNNYSLRTNEGLNLFDPKGDECLFILSVLCLMQATKRYPTLLRVSSSSVTNDFRLGGSEAPPAVISIYLGDDVEDILYRAVGLDRISYAKSSSIVIDRLGYLPSDHSDRNRTSPFAFTGNKFEFRMLGSSLSASDLNITLNTILGASYEELYDKIKDLEGDDLRRELKAIMLEMLEENEAILYGGDNYSAEWLEEAKHRGLPNYRTYLEALSHWDEEAEIFIEKNIFEEDELLALKSVLLDETMGYYEIEANACLYMLQKYVEPSVLQEISRHGKALSYVDNKAIKDELRILNESLEKLFSLKSDLKESLKESQEHVGMERALFLRDHTTPIVSEMCEIMEMLEDMVGEDLWCIPSYEDMLQAL